VIEKPDTVHGRLLEQMHIGSYTFERASKTLKWLLEDDKWKGCADGYELIDDFLATLTFAQFKMAIEERQELSKLLAEKRATQRAIAHTLGVGVGTINSDLRDVQDRTKKPLRSVVEPYSDSDVQNGTPPKSITQDAVDVVKAADKETTTREKREAKEAERVAKLDTDRQKIDESEPFKSITNTYATIMIDPPWSWADEGDQDQLGRAKPTYQGMSVGELLELDVGRVSADDAHIYLWITNRSIYKGHALLEAWGYRYITLLTWPKPSFGMGNYFRGQTEHIMFGVRGSLPLRRKDAPTLLPAWNRGPLGHSSKPVEIYPFVESCSPGPYIQIFPGPQREGWDQWGYREQ
jgi:N6-adenosine-specific RNA methylase IME4/Trp operon repressor